jgi:hypothetical protein
MMTDEEVAEAAAAERHIIDSIDWMCSQIEETTLRVYGIKVKVTWGRTS